MKVEISQSTTLTITGVDGLDPVTVFIQHFGENRYKVVVECYGSAWSAFFGNIGAVSIERFIATCGGAPDYLVNALMRGVPQHRMTIQGRAAHKAWLTQIVTAIRAVLKDAE